MNVDSFWKINPELYTPPSVSKGPIQESEVEQVEQDEQENQEAGKTNEAEMKPPAPKRRIRQKSKDLEAEDLKEGPSKKTKEARDEESLQSAALVSDDEPERGTFKDRLWWSNLYYIYFIYRSVSFSCQRTGSHSPIHRNKTHLKWSKLWKFADLQVVVFCTGCQLFCFDRFRHDVFIYIYIPP